MGNAAGEPHRLPSCAFFSSADRIVTPSVCVATEHGARSATSGASQRATTAATASSPKCWHIWACTRSSRSRAACGQQ
jgi:hypothetical protein